MERRLRANLGADSYDICIKRGSLADAGKELEEHLSGRDCLLLTDENVGMLYGDTVEKSLGGVCGRVVRVTIPAGESSKCVEQLSRLWSEMCRMRLTRDGVLVALGGGVVGDLGGFAAATYLRGIDYIQLPTSLLAQVDSSVGGKTAIDLPEGKNLAGAFYQPKAVLIDPDALRTLPSRILSDGMAEIIKCGCIRDSRLFELAEKGPDSLTEADMEALIEGALRVKLWAVEEDVLDKGTRMMLNFGHTLGHGIEKAQNFSGMRHGEAVAAGMTLITRLNEKNGLTKSGSADRIEACLKKWNLPVSAPRDIKEGMLSAVKLDKKHLGGGLTIVALEEIGKGLLQRVDGAFFQEVEAWLL